jgi:hypothetical protein
MKKKMKKFRLMVDVDTDRAITENYARKLLQMTIDAGRFDAIETIADHDLDCAAAILAAYATFNVKDS